MQQKVARMRKTIPWRDGEGSNFEKIVDPDDKTMDHLGKACWLTDPLSPTLPHSAVPVPEPSSSSQADQFHSETPFLPAHAKLLEHTKSRARLVFYGCKDLNMGQRNTSSTSRGDCKSMGKEEEEGKVHPRISDDRV